LSGRLSGHFPAGGVGDRKGVGMGRLEAKGGIRLAQRRGVIADRVRRPGEEDVVLDEGRAVIDSSEA
jgi:hypothetical protein